MPDSPRPTDSPTVEFDLDGRQVQVPDDGDTLLGALRGPLGIRTVKDGCSPQGQCGCCTVLVDGEPRVSCVTPVRRVAGRSVTTIDGLPDDRRDRWAARFCETGASQCGFCTPGIILRLDALEARGTPADDLGAVRRSLLAHLCRCTGWQTILEAWEHDGTPDAGRDLRAAAERAGIEGRAPQHVGPSVALGAGGFAADTAPLGAVVAVPVDGTEWAVGSTLHEARSRAGKVQGRRTTAPGGWPVELPDGVWDVTLQTTWVEPGYLETDAAWFDPAGGSAGPLANGGAFGSKLTSPVIEAAERLARARGEVVVALAGREDTVRWGAKRPPIAAGVRRDGTGIVRIGVSGDADHGPLVDAITTLAPGLAVELVAVAGPPTHPSVRGAGWAETVALMAAVRGSVEPVVAPNGAVATAAFDGDTIRVSVRCGRPLDRVVLRSYCIGAAHMAYSWVTSEGLSVDERGEVHDLTIRSFGIVRAVDTPTIEIDIVDDDGAPVNGSDAVFAAVAAAVWAHADFAPRWPLGAMMQR